MKPKYLILGSALICLIYVIKTLIQETDFDEVFWIAIVGLVFSLGAWFYQRKSNN